MSTEQETSNKRLQEVSQEAINGVSNTALNEDIPFYNAAACEHIIEGKNNTFLVLGRDRPAGITSGYGGRGHKKAGSIDLVAGRTSAIIKKFEADGTKVYTEPSTEYDAARISIIQKTDVDDNFNLPGNKIKGKSAVAIKADSIRGIARGGIKFVCNADKYDSTGELKVLKEGVQLIANDGADMQPVPLGDNLSEVITNIYEKISQQGSEIANLHKMLLTLLGTLSAHTHITAVGPAAPSIEMIAAGVMLSAEASMHVIDLQTQQMNIELEKLNALTPGSKKYINSLHHKLD